MARVSAWDFIQLHAAWGRTAVLKLRAVMERYNLAPKLIGVVSVAEPALEMMGELQGVVDAVLIDSSLRGGTGVRVPRDRLRKVVSEMSRPFLIAGGLKPENVVEVIREFGPWGVDVQSGVERPNGARQKDPALIEHFVRKVRALEKIGPNSA